MRSTNNTKIDNNEPVSLTDLPLLNVIDLTKRSLNFSKLKRNKTLSAEDLEHEIIVDTSLCQADLSEVEIEVNKKRKKKQKAEISNEMMSPASSVRNSI